MYVLDTNVISELRKLRGSKVAPAVKRWVESINLLDCYLTVITIQEIETGIVRVQGKDPMQAQAIRRWLEQIVLPDFDGRILSIDMAVARRCGPLHVPDNLPYRDTLIAAAALAHGMAVVTRNVSDFAKTGVHVINPWKDV